MLERPPGPGMGGGRGETNKLLKKFWSLVFHSKNKLPSKFRSLFSEMLERPPGVGGGGAGVVKQTDFRKSFGV